MTVHWRGERTERVAQVGLRTEDGSSRKIPLFWNFRLGSAGKPNICSHCYDMLNEEIRYVIFLCQTNWVQFDWQNGLVTTFHPLLVTRLGPCLNIKTVFPRYGDSHVIDKTLIINMGIPIPVRWHFYIEMAPRCPHHDSELRLCVIMTSLCREITIITNRFIQSQFSYNTIVFHGSHWLCYKGFPRSQNLPLYKQG